MDEQRAGELPVAGQPQRTPEAQAAGRPPVNPARLTLPQQIVANCLAWFCVELSLDGPNSLVVIEVLREQLPAAKPATGYIGRVVAAAETVVEAWPNRLRRADAASWNRAMMEADIAVANFLFWRAALAREALKPAPPLPDPGATPAAGALS